MLFVPIVASAALLAGCTGSPTPEPSPTPSTNGVEDLEPEAILEAATEALGEAESVHVTGTVGDQDLEITVDLVYAGDNVQGTVGLFGVDAEIIKIGSDVYVNADPQLFAQYLPPDQQALLPMLEGRWIKVDASMVGIVVPVPLDLETMLEPTGELTKGEVTTVDGTQAITVADSDGGEIHVAIEGEPYVLDMVFEGGGLTFSDFDEPADDVEAPDDALDLMELLGGTTTG